MNPLPGASPIYDYQTTFSAMLKVADLIYFDGPLLSLYRDSEGMDFIYYWCDCDESTNRWLIISVQNQTVRDFFAKQISLRNLIKEAKDKFIYCVDIDSNLKLENAFIISPRNLPPNYLPQEDSFYENIPEYVASDIYKIELDGSWTFNDLKMLPIRFEQIYNVIYASETADFKLEDRLKSDGFSHVHFFNRMELYIPAEKHIELKSVKYASPGAMQIKADSELLRKFKIIIDNFKTNRVQIREIYILTKLKLKDAGLSSIDIIKIPDSCSLTSDEIFSMSKVLMEIMKLKHDYFIRNTPNSILLIKTILAFYRRLKMLIEFEDTKKAFF